MAKDHRRTLLPAGLAAFLVVFWIGNHALGLDAAAIHWWADGAWTLASGAAALMCWRAARRVSGHQRTAWYLFAAGCGAWFLGMLIWDYLELVEGRLTPFPAASDIGFLLLAPLFMAGLIYYSQSAPSVTLTLKHVSNLGFILCSLIIVIVLILSEQIRDSRDPALYIAVAVAWPVLYFGLLLFGLYLLFTHRWGAHRGVMLLLVAGIAVHGMVNTIYAHELLTHDYAAGSYLDVFWLLGFAFVIWAAAEQAAVATVPAPSVAGRDRDVSLVEAMLPVAAIALITAVAVGLGGEVSAARFTALAPAAAGLLLFLLLWEWARFRIERELDVAVRESGERLRSLVDTAASVILYLSPRFDILEFNPAAERIYGVRRDDVIGRRYPDLFLPADVRDRVVAVMDDVLAGRPVAGYENEVVTAGGERRVLSWYSDRVLDADGRPAGIVAVGYDVTESRQAQHALDESRRMLRTVLDAIPVRVFWKDGESRYLGCNRLFAWDAGLTSPEEIVGRSDFDLGWRDHAERYRADDRQVISSGVPKFDYEEPQTTPDGRHIWLRTSKVPLTDCDGAIIGLLGTYEDVTARKITQQQAEERNLRLHRLSELSLTLSGDPREVFRQVARMIAELLDVPVVCLSEIRDDRVYFTAVYAHGEVTLDAGSVPLAGTPCAAEVQTGEIRVYHDVTAKFPGNEMLERYRAQTYCGFPACDRNGRVVAVTCLLDDERREFSAEDLGLLRILGQRIGMEIERQRHMSERVTADAQMRKLSSAIEQTADIVLISDRDGHIEYVNPAFEETTGYAQEEVLGKKSNIVRSGKHDDAFYRRLWDTINRGDVFQDVVINRRKNGDIYYEEKTITPLKDDAGNITHFISTGKDITERMQIQERLYHLAYHDILTELPNRALFVDRLDHALARQRDGERCMAVLFMDLDRFKNINDTLGHDIGDRLLQMLSERLLENLRESDTVARLAGDEFVILLEDVDSAEDVAPICRKILAALTRPFVINGNELYMTSSIGISLFPSDGADASTLLRNADIAMYRAKELGRNNFQFYSADMSAKAFERLTLETSLRHALERNEFRLYYQPQISLESGRIIGVEALLRWQHPDFGLVQPGDFIPLLEDTGLIVPAGEWVLREAMSQAMEWQEAGFDPIRVAINLSSRQFDGRQLLDTIMNLVRETSLPTRWLELEITESLLMNNERLTLEMLQAFSDAGIRLSIDDFGTGYSSLGYLKRFPIDTIKIDGSFVRDITTDPDDAAIVRAIIAMATSLKLDVIAEGVESRAQLDFLRDQRCACLQGFLFSRPLPVDDMTELLRRDNAGGIEWHAAGS